VALYNLREYVVETNSKKLAFDKKDVNLLCMDNQDATTLAKNLVI